MFNRFSRSFAGVSAAATLLACAPAIAEETVAVEAAAPVAEASASGPALWSVADEDTTIYLFGTVHALPKGLEWMDEDISNALKSSDTIVTEVDLKEMAGPKMIQIIQTTAVLPQGTTLRSLLDEEQTKTYEAAMAQIQVPAAAFDQFEPWYAGMMVTMLPLMQQGYSPDAGVEEVLLKEAGSIEKTALETVEFQLGVFDQLPQENQITFLVEAAENVGQIKPMLDAMVAEWLEGDAEGLAVMMNESLDDPELAEALLYSRNRNWADWIETRMASPGTVFMAVGAGHLAGEESVQDYLEQRGVVVTRIQ